MFTKVPGMFQRSYYFSEIFIIYHVYRHKTNKITYLTESTSRIH